MLHLGSILFEHFSCVGTKEDSLNFLAHILFFISGLCFGHYVAYFYLRRLINDDIDSFFVEYSAKNKKMSKIVANKYVPTYQEDYYKLPWYERDMMSYIDYLKYKDMHDDPDSYFKNVRMVNFDIINHECHGNKLAVTYKDYKTIKNDHLTNYPTEKAKHVLPAVFRNKGDDLWVKRDLMIKYFSKNFN